MSNQNSTWDRRELYEKVWQFPLRKLAAEYGISDVGLAKVCRKLEIPLPGLGHWTKIACGHSIPRPPLPALESVPVLVRQIRKPEAGSREFECPHREAGKLLILWHRKHFGERQAYCCSRGVTPWKENCEFGKRMPQSPRF